MVGLRGMAGVALAGFWAASSLAGTAGRVDGWELEQGVERPSYAVIAPQRSDLNIESLVLACEEAADRKVLQLQLYLSTEGPLLPKGASAQRLKDDPHVEIAIDGRRFPAGILFAGDYAVIADETDQMFPRLSERLLDSLEEGNTLVLRFDLLAEPSGQPVAFDGEAVIALQAGAGGRAVAAVRRCASVADYTAAAHARP